MTNNFADMIALMITGGLLGAGGQCIRSLLGLIKMKSEPYAQFSAMRLVINVLVGFVIGSLGLSLLVRSAVSEIGVGQGLMLIAFGYAGGDVAERIVKLCARNRTPVSSVAKRPETTRRINIPEEVTMEP